MGATESADIPMTQDTQQNDTIVEIPTEFAGAPEKVICDTIIKILFMSRLNF